MIIRYKCIVEKYGYLRRWKERFVKKKFALVFYEYKITLNFILINFISIYVISLK